MHLIYRNSCRVCGSQSLTRVINLGEQYLQGSFVKASKEMPSIRKIPMSLVRCDPSQDQNACGLLQMECSVPPEILYSAYWYRSGTNNTMREHLKGIVEEAFSISESPISYVLDIGCNDGFLLNSYPDEVRKFGIDPSDVTQQISADIEIIQDIFPSNELLKKIRDLKFNIITSIAMFYDLENPIEFARAVKKILAPDGLWIFEMSYMPQMLKMNSYDTICHEHLEYYSLAVIEYILKQAGLQLINVSLNEINGGSIRCHAAHADCFIYKNDQFLNNIRTLRREEFDMELDTDKPYRNFQERINIHREELGSLLKTLKKEGKRIHVYGASTKGNTILQWCNIDCRTVEVAAERNPDKYGAHTIGTDIPIISEAESRAMRPDYYLVLPWHFKKEFLEREAEMFKQGVGFIFPLPSITIVKN
jgi:hypothetical protein